MSGFKDLFSEGSRTRTAAIGAVAAVGVYAAYRGARAIYDYMYPARAHVRDMRAAGMRLDGITPDALAAGRAGLRSRAIMPATSMHDNISLVRRRGQSAEHFSDFMVETRRALHTIGSQPIGRQMLDDLNAGLNTSVLDGRSTVTISDARFGRQGYNANAGNNATGENAGNARQGLGINTALGAGAATMVHFNPTITRSDGRRPAFIGLAHELVHAERNQMGAAIDRQGGNPVRELRDELETVGLLPGPQPTTENAIRNEHGIGNRTAYGGQTPQTYRQMLLQIQQAQQARNAQAQPQGGQGGAQGGTQG